MRTLILDLLIVIIDFGDVQVFIDEIANRVANGLKYRGVAQATLC